MTKREMFTAIRSIVADNADMVAFIDKEIALLEPFAVLLCDLEVGLDKLHCRYSSKTDDDLGLYKTHLSAKIVDASLFLFGKRVSVFWRSAFKDICYVDAFTRNVNGEEKLVKELSRTSYKGNSCFVLLLTRCFAYEKKIGILISRSEDAVGLCLPEGAFLTFITFII